MIKSINYIVGFLLLALGTFIAVLLLKIGVRYYGEFTWFSLLYIIPYAGPLLVGVVFSFGPYKNLKVVVIRLLYYIVLVVLPVALFYYPNIVTIVKNIGGLNFIYTFVTAGILSGIFFLSELLFIIIDRRMAKKKIDVKRKSRLV